MDGSVLVTEMSVSLIYWPQKGMVTIHNPDTENLYKVPDSLMKGTACKTNEQVHDFFKNLSESDVAGVELMIQFSSTDKDKQEEQVKKVKTVGELLDAANLALKQAEEGKSDKSVAPAASGRGYCVIL